MTKLISFAGVSKVNGELKFRGANNQARITQLKKLGDTEVEMRYLGREMTKSQAAKELLAMNFANGRADIDALLVSVAQDDNPFVKPKKAGTVRVKSTKGDPVEAYFLAVEADDVKLTPKQAAKIRAEFCERVRQAYEAN
jgi:hypothetical protein